MNLTTLARAALVFIVLLLALFLYQGIEITKVDGNKRHLDKFYSEPFVVLQHFLQADGVEVEVIQGYDQAKFQPSFYQELSTDATVAFRLAEVQIDDVLASSILDWVDRGGMLILSGLTYGEAYQIKGNGLFMALDVAYEWPDEASYIPAKFELENFYDIELNFASEHGFSDHIIDENVDFWVGNETVINIIQKPIGEGYVTLMSNIEIWRNDKIDEVDNAVFASFLLKGKEKLIIFGTSDKPHWLVSLWQFTPASLFLLALLLAFSLWYFALRFGSIQKLHARNESAFIRHLQASSNYYWRVDKHQQWLEKLRGRIRQDIRKKFALRHDSDFSQILPQLSELTGLSQQVIVHVLQDWQPASESDYVSLIKQLQILRNSL